LSLFVTSSCGPKLSPFGTSLWSPTLTSILSSPL
jgi:hypothetical protein